jgi:hypothetical protein
MIFAESTCSMYIKSKAKPKKKSNLTATVTSRSIPPQMPQKLKNVTNLIKKQPKKKSTSVTTKPQKVIIISDTVLSPQQQQIQPINENPETASTSNTVLSPQQQQIQPIDENPETEPTSKPTAAATNRFIHPQMPQQLKNVTNLIKKEPKKKSTSVTTKPQKVIIIGDTVLSPQQQQIQPINENPETASTSNTVLSPQQQQIQPIDENPETEPTNSVKFPEESSNPHTIQNFITYQTEWMAKIEQLITINNQVNRRTNEKETKKAKFHSKKLKTVAEVIKINADLADKDQRVAAVNIMTIKFNDLYTIIYYI